MFEDYKVPADIAIRLEVEEVRKSIKNIFKAFECPEENAKRMADVLLYADIHGISHMMQWYTLGLRKGWINPAPACNPVREAPACATLDGDRGIGLDVGPQAMDLAMDKADACGMGAVAVTNSWHFGAAGYYAAQGIKRDMVGIAMTSAGLFVTPTFGAKAMLRTNPIAAPTVSHTTPMSSSGIVRWPRNLGSSTVLSTLEKERNAVKWM